MQSTLTASKRIISIDVLRGLVMIIMALDHTRDFFTNVTYDPLDLTQTSPQLFLTRWITHYCAPIFVFLAGCSVFLSIRKGKTKNEAARFLLTRGLWLIIVELVIVNFAFSFDIGYHFLGVQVIWAIGWSMIFLAALIYIKPLYAGIIGLLIVFSHNLLDGIRAESFGNAKLLWMFLHEQGFISYAKDRGLGVLYPIIPWIGVMASGYAFGWFFTIEQERRRNYFLKIGWSCITLFIIVRYSNIYGDLRQWQHQDTWWKSVLSFINCQKYPPSLLYLLMTIGPGILLLNLFEKYSNRITQVFSVYGSVPFFYYILHFFIIHLSAVIVAKIIGVNGGNLFNPDPAWGFGLPIVYLIWLLVVASLYYACKWFMGIKKRRNDWWLSYL